MSSSKRHVGAHFDCGRGSSALGCRTSPLRPSDSPDRSLFHCRNCASGVSGRTALRCTSHGGGQRESFEVSEHASKQAAKIERRGAQEHAPHRTRALLVPARNVRTFARDDTKDCRAQILASSRASHRHRGTMHTERSSSRHNQKKASPVRMPRSAEHGQRIAPKLQQTKPATSVIQYFGGDARRPWRAAQRNVAKRSRKKRTKKRNEEKIFVCEGKKKPASLGEFGPPPDDADG